MKVEMQPAALTKPQRGLHWMDEDGLVRRDMKAA